MGKDPNDNSGIDFLNEATDPSVSLLKYMWNARGGKVWDFKLTNGTKGIKKKNCYIYQQGNVDMPKFFWKNSLCISQGHR